MGHSTETKEMRKKKEVGKKAVYFEYNKTNDENDMRIIISKRTTH